jgi:hypothetical protein
MNRSFGWAMLVAVGMVLGYALSCHESIQAAPPAPEEVAAKEQQAELAGQLKDIKKQVAEINDLLHNGLIKVVVVLNPETK